MKNILLPTDFSENAWNAVQYAIGMYKNETCVFYLLNTYTPDFPQGRFIVSEVWNAQLLDDVQKHSKHGLQKLLRRLKKNHNNTNHSFRTISAFTFLVEEIKDRIETYKIDLVVIGMQGVSDLEGVSLGSNAQRILGAVRKCPVLAVPKYFLFKTIQKIVLATDFSRLYYLSELYPIIDLALAFKASVQIVNIQDELGPLSDREHYNLGRFNTYLEPVVYTVHILCKQDSIAATLQSFIRKMDVHTEISPTGIGICLYLCEPL